VGLTEVLVAHPLEQGLAEFVAYLALSDIDLAVVFDESNPQEYQWSDETGRQVVARIPRVTFARPGRVIDALPDDGSTPKDTQ
jgi:predicted nucleotidyltransferase